MRLSNAAAAVSPAAAPARGRVRARAGARRRRARRGAPPRSSAHRSIVVDNCNDAGAGSLRDAVDNAADGDTIDLTQLACSTISLSTGAILIGIAGSHAARARQPPADDPGQRRLGLTASSTTSAAAR